MDEFEKYISYLMKTIALEVLPEYTCKTDRIVKRLMKKRVIGIRYYGRIQQFRTIEEAAGSGFCNCYENSCIYLPKSKLTDEQLLEIIELQYVRNYALSENRKVEESTSVNLYQHRYRYVRIRI